MGKLIDADVFDSILQDAQAECKKNGGNFRFGVLNSVRANLANQPAVDAAPVVRCRDCKHRPTDNRVRDDDPTGLAIEFPDSRCPCQCEDGWYNWYPNDDWFCANGERRDDDGSAD